MFDNKRTLIVVYKDEILLNQMKKLIETNDDKEDEIVGTKDKSINVVSWDEKRWLEEKKKGTVTDKVLFIGSIKDTDKLIPVIDVKFEEYGMKYGWAGNQAIINANIEKLSDKKDYQNFLNVINSLQIPENIKNANRIDDALLNRESMSDQKKAQNVKEFFNIGFKKVQYMIKNAGIDITVFAKDFFKDKKMVEQQILFYGIIKFYYDHLEEFIKA